MILLLLLVLAARAETCHPECRDAHDDVVCLAVCWPVCAPPVCQRCVNTTLLGPQCRPAPRCWVRCPPGQCESESCPQCETVCRDQCGTTPGCTILCEETQCTWLCAPASTCPRVPLVCDAPACQYSAGATAPLSLALLLVLVLLL